MDTRLLDVLVCPICKRTLEYDKAAQELICRSDKLAYPIRDGIPIMWSEEARPLFAAAGSAPDSVPGSASDPAP